MEQYANFGFHKIQEKIEENGNYFFRNTGFLNLILDLAQVGNSEDKANSIEDL